MNLKTIAAFGLSALLLSATTATPVFAAETKMTPEMEAQMKKMQELGSPSAGHKILEPFIGKWTNVVKFWMKPGEAPHKSEGTNENTWILGGRYVQQKYNGTWNGQPFEGMGITGYDNLRGEYQSLWLDNMSTGVMIAAGPFDPKAKSVNVIGNYSCPMTGDKNRWYRSEWKILSKDKHTYTAYDRNAQGKEYRSMEITFTRAK